MRRSVLVLLIGMWCCCATAAAHAQSNDIRVITVRIHDYADLAIDVIDQAQQRVTDLYAAIGVHIVWAETIHPTEMLQSRERDRNELLINILTPAMSERMAVTLPILGLAPVTLHDGGQIAYVFFDRVCRSAGAAARRVSDVLGLVVAHELGHLLLPYGSHSSIGLMRSPWSIDDFRTTDHQHFNFTRPQGERIRELLGRRAGRTLTGDDAGPPSAVGLISSASKSHMADLEPR